VRQIKRQKTDNIRQESEQIDTTTREKSQKRSVFPSLRNEEAAKRLEEFINQAKAKSEAYNSLHNVAASNRTRKNVKESFSYALMLGVEEAKEHCDL